MVPKPGFNLLVSILALLLASPIPIQPVALTDKGLQAVPPMPSTPITPPLSADLNRDGQPEHLSLTDGSLSILSGDETVWQSPSAWQVNQAAFTDLNRDGTPEAALLVWREFAPWPIDQWLPYGGRIAEFHNPENQSCHLILVGWAQGKYRDLWAGSALAEPVLEFAAVDLDGDGVQELLTLDGSYNDPHASPARTFMVWEWNGFGFTAVDSIPGKFIHMQPVRSPDGRVQVYLFPQLSFERSSP